MARAADNWSLDSYTLATWTDFVAEPAILASIIITNTSGGDATVEMRLEDGGVKLSTILPPTVVATNTPYVLDIRSLNITGTQALQIRCDVAGVEFTASGAV